MPLAPCAAALYNTLGSSEAATMTDQSTPPPVELEHLLGDLERAIMQVVWARGEVTVRDVWNVLRPARPLAYTTVMTVMSRLAHKGVLATRKHGRAYSYHARVTPDTYVTQRAQQAVEQVIATFGDVALAQFLRNLDDLSPDRRAALQHLIDTEHADAP